MKHKLLHERSGERTYVLAFQTGDDVVPLLLDFARRERLRASRTPTGAEVLTPFQSRLEELLLSSFREAA